MIWGCFTSRGVGSYCKVDGTMDAELYRRILREDLMWTISDHGFDVEEVIFQQDGASVHTATLTKRWLRRNKIKFFDWPPNLLTLTPSNTCGLKLIVVLGTFLVKFQVRETFGQRYS